MKYKSILSVLLCCATMMIAVSCSRTNDMPEQSAGADNTTAKTTAAEVETAEPVNWNISTERYSIQEIDGKCYITFKDEYAASEEDRKACQLMEVYFDSMDDMVQAFLHNGLDPNQEICIQAVFPKTDNGISLWSADELYAATLPEGVEVSSFALQSGSYDFFLKGENLKSGWISCLENWSADKNRMYDWSKGATITLDETSTFDGVPCRIVEYIKGTETYRDIFIETKRDGKTVYMVLRYLLEDQRMYPERVSDTAPWTVKMFCENNGVYYYVSLKELTETPTYKWLSSFGLTPYVPASGDLATE